MNAGRAHARRSPDIQLADRALRRAGAKLSGAAGFRASPGAGGRAELVEQHRARATLRARFTRKPWRAIGGPVSALIGYRGLAWAHAFRHFARTGEPIKFDGDKRAPAGFFRIGRSFGFAPSRLPHYLRIAAGMVCVADPASPAYNTIATRAKVGWRVRGENMWRVPDYRRGLLVDYPTDRKDRAGSCIFIHVRQPGRSGTSGCVALPEREVATLQGFAQSDAVLAILPQQALRRFKGCLP